GHVLALVRHLAGDAAVHVLEEQTAATAGGLDLGAPDVAPLQPAQVVALFLAVLAISGERILCGDHALTSGDWWGATAYGHHRAGAAVPQVAFGQERSGWRYDGVAR